MVYVCKICGYKHKERANVRAHVKREHIKKDLELKRKYKSGELRIQDLIEYKKE